jgi:hypothetical protein
MNAMRSGFQWSLVIAASSLLVISLVSVPAATAQSTSHVFPQVVDGVNADGAFWQSLIYATNLSGTDASCTISLYRQSDNGHPFQEMFLVASRSVLSLLQASNNPAASGYARLDCSQPVTAALIYKLTANDGTTTLGMATVFSSPATNYMLFPVLFPSSLRTGVAIANDNDMPLDVTVRFTDSNKTVTAQMIQIPARSQRVGFVDEILGLASLASGVLEIYSEPGPQFNAVGLVFAGNVFSTLVPASN